MFRFTIRDVLWLTVVVALAAAWWLDHSRYEGERVLKAREQVLIDRYMKLQQAYSEWNEYAYVITRELKAKGYIVQRDGDGYWEITPPLQLALQRSVEAEGYSVEEVVPPARPASAGNFHMGYDH